MKIATWNVNSCAYVCPMFELAQAGTARCSPFKKPKWSIQVPSRRLAEAGYRSVYSGQKTYNGVAVLSKPIRRSGHRSEGFDDPQRRSWR